MLNMTQQLCCRSICTICRYQLTNNRVLAKGIFHQIWIAMEKALVKWVHAFYWNFRGHLCSLDQGDGIGDSGMEIHVNK